MTTKELKKSNEYAAKIYSHIAEIFDEECDYYISKEDLDLTLFFHALSTMAPNVLFNKLTYDDKNNLEFNHLMNQLCFQFSNIVTE